MSANVEAVAVLSFNNKPPSTSIMSSARPQPDTVLEYSQGCLLFTSPEDGRKWMANIREKDFFRIEQLHKLSPAILEKCDLVPRNNYCWGRFTVVDDVDCIELEGFRCRLPTSLLPRLCSLV